MKTLAKAIKNKTSLVVIAGAVMLLIMAVLNAEEDKNEVKRYPGMVIKKEGDVNVIVPKGGRIVKHGEVNVIEDAAEYAAREIAILNQKIAVLVRESNTLKKEINDLKESVKQIMEQIDGLNRKT